MSQNYTFFVILDFEATCDENSKPRPNPQEIIEFPALKVNAITYDIEDEFQQFVKPVKNPQLTEFCKNLTSIQQKDVDNACEFGEVFHDFQLWIEREINDKCFIFVTFGDWDLKTMLPSQCRTSGMELPDYCKRWINVITEYRKATDDNQSGFINIPKMLSRLGIDHTGTLHRGIDDCRNTLKILKALADRGHIFSPSAACIS